MANKIFMYGLVWLLVLIAYLVLAFTMPAIQGLVTDTSAEFATQNMTGIVGVEDAVTSSHVWLWILPGAVGVVISVGVLLKK